jgi:hypothetical protein
MINIVGYDKIYVTIIVANVYDDVTIVYSPHYPNGTFYLGVPSMEYLGLERSFSKNLNLQPNCI